MTRWKRNVLFAVLAVAASCALFGGYKLLYWFQLVRIESYVASVENPSDFHPDLRYHNEGTPTIWTRPENETTLFFLEGFRAMHGAGLYRGWFGELLEEHGVNVVSPIYGLQSWPYQERNRQWFFAEDMRFILQVYAAYTANLPADHQVVVASQSFGIMGALAIAAMADRRPDRLVFFSPLNTGLDYQVHGPVMAWLSGQIGWLRHLVPMAKKPHKAPGRESRMDIVNAEKNLYWHGRSYQAPEENADQAHGVRQAIHWMEERLIGRVKGYPITMIWGDSDQLFSQAGFQDLAAALTQSGNQVQTLVARETGHLTLLDNDEERVKQAVLRLLAPAPSPRSVATAQSAPPENQPYVD